MKIFKDADIQYYLKLFFKGLLIFLVLGIILFFIYRPKKGIVLKQDTVEIGYNTKIKIVDLIKSVNGYEVNHDNIISSNTIVLGEYEVTFNEIDTTKLGKQTITARFSNNDMKPIEFTIKVIDTTKPKIFLKEDEPYDITLENAKKGDFRYLYQIIDNYTSVGKIKVKSFIKEKNYTYGDHITLRIEAIDESSNMASKEMKMVINDKIKTEEDIAYEKIMHFLDDYKNKDEDKLLDYSDEYKIISSKQKENVDKRMKKELGKTFEEKIKEITKSIEKKSHKKENINQDETIYSEPKKNESPSNNPSNQNITNNSRPVPPAPKPADKYFMFEDGYDMETAPQQCQLELMNSGRSGACIPIQDSEGIYKGMKLEYR